MKKIKFIRFILIHIIISWTLSSSINAQVISSFRVNNQTMYYLGEDITIDLDIKNAPSNFILKIEEVKSDPYYITTLQSYEVVSNSKILLKFGVNGLRKSLNWTIKIKTNAGEIEFNIFQEYDFQNRFWDGKVVGCETQIVWNDVYLHTQQITVNKDSVYYNNVMVMSGYNAKVREIRVREIDRHRIKNEYWVVEGTKNNYYYSEETTTRDFSFKITQDVCIYKLYVLNSFEEVESEKVYYKVISPEDIQSIKIINAGMSGSGAFIYYFPEIRLSPFVETEYRWESRFFDSNEWTQLDYNKEWFSFSKNIDYKNRYFRRGMKVNNTWVYSPVFVMDDFTEEMGGQIYSDIILYKNQSIKINSVESASNGTFAWEKKEEGASSWTTISGATGKDYTVNSISTNTTFRRKTVASNSTFYSNEWTIWVKPGNNTKEIISLDESTTGPSARNRTTIAYTDGFGKDIQTVLLNGSPRAGSDLILPQEYGVFGREDKNYLPYAKANNNGKYDANYASSSNWTHLDASDRSYAYTKKEYDNSPLNRIQSITGPGASWHTNSKSVNYNYDFNSANQVKEWTINKSGKLVYKGYYNAGTLSRVITSDEDGNLNEIYKDRSGRAILTVAIDGSNRLETYTVYDNRGLLRYVLSPEATRQLGTVVNETIIKQYAYYYEYDAYGRNILKRLPGCEPIYMVYDKKDRLVMSQDGNQRSTNTYKWSYSLFDDLNRPIQMGEVILYPTKTYTTLLTEVGGSNNYTPVGSLTPLQYTLYDSYEAGNNVTIKAYSAISGYSTTYNKLTSGLVTGTKTKILGTTNDWLTTTIYYDDKCRVIQNVSDNIQGGISRIDINYDFIGNVTKTRESHTRTGTSNADIVETINTYDNWGRLLTTSTQLNNGNKANVSYSYNEVGNLASKTYGSNLLTENLSYNARGWLTSKTSNKFSMKLRYDSPEFSSTTKRFNGNISEWEWQHGTSAALMYGFKYDNTNRLLESNQYQKSGTSWTALTSNYLEKGITYDFNGNIKTLQRTANGAVVDNLTYTYTGNQLTGLNESISGSPSGDIFLVGNSATGTYQYDENGNMVLDNRKSLTLTYNSLNLLNEVIANSVLKAKYYYLADGSKLRVRDGAGTNGFDYIGSLTYIQSSTGISLEAANFREYRIIPSGSTSVVQYHVADHLGSVRAIVDASGNVIEKNDYYPFGARHMRADYTTTTNRFKYNGKEEQTSGDLKYLDYGWRNYDNTLGRWFGVDPMSESYFPISPYNYTAGNPVRFIDPDGMSYDDYIVNQNGQIALWRITDDPFDRLYATNENSSEVDENKHIDVEKGILDNINTDHDINDENYSYFYMKDHDKAEELFKFLGMNTKVEWGHVKFGTISNYIATSHSPILEAGAADLAFKLLDKNYTVRSLAHSHPKGIRNYYGASGYLGFDRSLGDYEFAKWVYKYYPDKAKWIELKVYEPQVKAFFPFDDKKAYMYDRKNKKHFTHEKNK